MHQHQMPSLQQEMQNEMINNSPGVGQDRMDWIFQDLSYAGPAIRPLVQDRR